MMGQYVDSFKAQMRDFDGTLPEISVLFENRESLGRAIGILIANANLAASSMAREGSRKRELISDKYGLQDVILMIQEGRHLLLKKSYGLPDLGVGVLEDSLRIDFKPGDEWNDEQITRLADVLRKLRERSGAKEIYLDEMQEHFNEDSLTGFQELVSE
ncbi:MAG: hypothetical protein EBR09_09785 [Proteobacteria bacterium]|nr:hypothetical protein [Pseudomonadota bacterium]